MSHVLCELGYIAPSRQTVSRRLKRLHVMHRTKLIDVLKRIDHVAITTDFWTNRRIRCFLVITGHYFANGGFDLKSTILDFSTFNKQHTSYEISRILKAKLIELDIAHKVICVTCDGARNMVNAVDNLNLDAKRLWCVAHRLHLTVTNAFGFWIKKKKEDSNSTTAAAAADDDDEEEEGMAAWPIIYSPPSWHCEQYRQKRAWERKTPWDWQTIVHVVLYFF